MTPTPQRQHSSTDGTPGGWSPAPAAVRQAAGARQPATKQAPEPAASPAVRAAAVVLAAGSSSRMGSLKPLLPLGETTALERVVGTLRVCGVDPVVVVTGHEAGRLVPLIERVGAVAVHNQGHLSGMFSSVRTGVAALSGDLDAFFVLPVDCPLVSPRAVRLLLEHFERSGKGILYPTCFGRRGHPPLVASRYTPALRAADAGGDLRAFLADRAEDECEVDVADLTVLLDMDRPSDHQTLQRLAAALDAAATSGAEPSLTADDAVFLLAAAGTPANIVRHCRTAAAVGEALATALEPRVAGLDVSLVRAGCLLHDIARTLPDHARVAAEALANLGLPRLGEVVREHMVIDAHLPLRPGITEAELVYLSDKMVADGEVVGLDERQARTLRKMAPDGHTAERIKHRISEARAIAGKVEAILGRAVEEHLRDVELPAEARSGVMQVYLVRHGACEGPEGRRFRGQSDPPLSAVGEEQARRLAARLMVLTGGACFDAVISSDMERSRRTAEIVAGDCGTRVVTDPRLREIDVGLWEGLSWEEANRHFPAEHAAREQDLTGTPFPGGESFAHLRVRVMAAFESLLRAGLAAGHRRLLVVGHKGVNRVILTQLRGRPLNDIFSIEQGLCAATCIEVAPAEAGSYTITALEPR